MQSYISHRRGRVFNPLISFFLFCYYLTLSIFMKNIGSYRKYDIFFNFRFTENMIFPTNAENLENNDIYVQRFYENVVFHPVGQYCVRTIRANTRAFMMIDFKLHNVNMQ